MKVFTWLVRDFFLICHGYSDMCFVNLLGLRDARTCKYLTFFGPLLDLKIKISNSTVITFVLTHILKFFGSFVFRNDVIEVMTCSHMATLCVMI